MGRLHVRGNPRRIARSMAPGAHQFVGVENTEAANQSKLWFAERSIRGEQEAVPPEEVQEGLWRQFFANTAQWWDNRRSKPTPRHPDFRHKETNVPLWLSNRHKPGWVDSRLATIDASSKTSSNIRCSPAQGPEPFEPDEGDPVGDCRKVCDDGVISDAVDALVLLVQRGCPVPNSLFYRVVKRCIQDKDLASGRRIHNLIGKSGYDGVAFLANHLMVFYASHSRLEEAMDVFRKVSTPNLHNWATIIHAYARHGEAAEAIRLYREMYESTSLKPDDRLYSAVLKACAAAKDLVAGQEVHAHILASTHKPDRFVQGGLVNMYAKCGCLKEARRLFDELSDKNVVTWTAMIGGYAQQGMGQEALSLYSRMQQEGFTANSVTYVCLLQACASAGVTGLHEGKQLHAQIEERGLEKDVFVGGSLVNMYAKCGSVKDARKQFDKLPYRNILAWNAMIAGYAKQGGGQEALRLYSDMQQDGRSPDYVTYVCVLQACANVGVDALHEGKKLHARIIGQNLEENTVLGGSLVNMYAKCGSLEDARNLFDKLPNRNLVAWTAMIAGYAQQGMGEEALSLYSSMQQDGLVPDFITYICLLQACAAAAALPLGEQLHSEVKERGMLSDGNVGAALVNMYAKCGRICDSHLVFDSLSERSLGAWNALLSGYARQGDSQIVFDLLSRMKSEGVHPDEITFLSVLTVCSHVGLVEKGRECFAAMGADHGLSATMDHYICMVDLLGRAGHLHEALGTVKSMPFPPNYVVWLTLLGACRIWKNVEIGQHAFRGAVSVDATDSAAYMLMSNIYESAQMWDASKELNARRAKLGVWKKPGQSWTDMGGMMYTFLVGDKERRDSENLYCELQQLIPKLASQG